MSEKDIDWNKNHYDEGDRRYPDTRIRDFVQSQQNITQTYRMRADQVAKDPFFQEFPEESRPLPVDFDKIYRFIDGQYTTAFALHHDGYTDEYEDEYAYRLVYLDPSLIGLWNSDMVPHIVIRSGEKSEHRQGT